MSRHQQEPPMPTPTELAANALIIGYANQLSIAAGPDGTGLDFVVRAVFEAETHREVCYLGIALLERHEELGPSPFCYGHKNYPVDLQAIAEALGWTPDRAI